MHMANPWMRPINHIWSLTCSFHSVWKTKETAENFSKWHSIIPSADCDQLIVKFKPYNCSRNHRELFCACSSLLVTSICRSLWDRRLYSLKKIRIGFNVTQIFPEEKKHDTAVWCPSPSASGVLNSFQGIFITFMHHKAVIKLVDAGLTPMLAQSGFSPQVMQSLRGVSPSGGIISKWYCLLKR